MRVDIVRAAIAVLCLALPLFASVEFGGEDAQVRVEFDSTQINVGQLGHNLSEFTYSCWIRSLSAENFEAFAGNETSPYKHLFFGRNGVSNDIFVRISASGDNDQQWTTSSPLSLVDWNHVAIVFDGSQAVETDKCRIYVDGVLQPDATAGTMPAVTRNGTTDFYIGSGRDDASYWFGAIDDPRFYSRAFTAKEVSALFSSTRKTARKRTPGLLASDLIGHWEFRDGPIDRQLNVNRDYISGIDARPTTGVQDLFFRLSTDKPANAPGRFSLGLPGTEYMTCLDNDRHSFTDGSDLPFSLTAWVKLDALNGQSLISKGEVGVGEYHFRLSNSSGNNMIIQLWSGGTAVVQKGRFYSGPVSDLFTVGTWAHVAATYDPGGATIPDQLKLYVDGVRVDTNTTQAGSYVGMVNTDQNLQIGRYLNTAEYLAGTIDDMRMYGFALTAAQVTALYNNDVQSVDYPGLDNLVSYWDCESVHVPLDSSGNGNDGGGIGGVMFFGPPATK